ncbi:hypothetical protein NPIL_471731 [Nephila pilipes]|uniref:Uncharacterized protein n=1 Tax=Nephila pilipes TaxID=299642 RepID=A0A8X6NY00_NEPPI|nr:hypothetical protein NPIL_471731 [Nephila pilipes]
MGIKIAFGMKKTDLQKIILEFEDYEDEFVREMLESIKECIESREQLEAKKRRDKTEFLMEEMFKLMEIRQYLRGFKCSTELKNVKPKSGKLKQGS